MNPQNSYLSSKVYCVIHWKCRSEIFPCSNQEISLKQPTIFVFCFQLLFYFMYNGNIFFSLVTKGMFVTFWFTIVNSFRSGQTVLIQCLYFSLLSYKHHCHCHRDVRSFQKPHAHFDIFVQHWKDYNFTHFIEAYYCLEFIN